MKTTARIRNISAAIIIAALAMISASSCVDNDDPTVVSGVIALATYEQTTSAPNANGGVSYTSTFTYYGPDDSAPTILIAAANIDQSNLKPGQRCIIEYTPANYANPTASGQITLIRYKGVPTSSVTTASTETAQAANAAINLLYINGQPSLNRTGKYINVEAYMPIVEGRTFSIVADEATLNTAMPDLYLTTSATGTPQGYSQTELGSIDIQSVWGRPDVEGVRLHINNTNPSYQQKIFEFKK